MRYKRAFPWSVAAALAAAAAVLGAAAGSATPYVAAARDAAFEQEARLEGSASAGLQVITLGRATSAEVAAADAELREAVAALPLDEPVFHAYGSVARLELADELRVRLVAVSGADLDVPTDGSFSQGLWLPASLAETTGLEPGDELAVRFGEYGTSAQVGGTYSDLDADALPVGLENLAGLLEVSERSDRELPPLLLGSPETVADAVAGLRDPLLATWVVPADAANLPAADARSALPVIRRISSALGDTRTPLGEAFAVVNRSVGGPEVTSGLAGTVARADAAVGGLAPPVRLLSLAGVIAALLVVAAAARFAARQRSVELRLAAVRGARPAIVGVRAAALALAPLALGTAAGCGLALALVAAAGPDARVDGEAALAAAVATGAALLVAAAVVGVIVAVATTQEIRVRRSRVGQVLAQVPWDGILLVLSLIALYQLRARGGVEVGSDGALTVNLLALAFPLLFVAGASLGAVRLLGMGLPRLRRVGGSLPPAAFLALRRLSSARSGALLLVGSGAVAFGILTHAGVIATSVRAGVDDKALVQVGSDIVVPAEGDLIVPNGVVGALVLRGDGTLQPGNAQSDVIAVEPDDFAQAVLDGRRGVAGGAGSSELAALSEGHGERLPALIVGAEPAERATLQLRDNAVPLEVIARPDAFPGLDPARPLVVVGANALADLGVPLDLVTRERELWLRGEDDAALLDAVASAGGDPLSARSAAAVAAEPRLVAVTWTFGYLQALGTLVGLLAVAGTVLYVQARHDARAVATALTSRMGFARRTQRLATAGELLALLALALVIGTVLGVGAGPLVVGALDPVPQLPPEPSVRTPLALLAGLAALLVLVGWFGSGAVQRGADKTDPSEVLRRAV